MSPSIGGDPADGGHGNDRRGSDRRHARDGAGIGSTTGRPAGMQILHGVEGRLGRTPARLLTSGGDGRRDVFHVTFDPAEEDVTEVVVRSVAVIHNVEPADLPPLGDVVDVDALAALFGPAAEAFDSDVQATFVYRDLEITVGSDGDLWLEWV